jgi:transposase
LGTRQRQVLREVRVPTVEQDDARRGLRERQRLVKERTGNRIKGLLKTQGTRAADATARLDAIVTGDGRPLAPCLNREIVRELVRLALVMRQIDQVETERDAVVQSSTRGPVLMLLPIVGDIESRGKGFGKAVPRVRIRKR